MLLFSVICFNLIFLHQGYLISASNPACTELRNPGYGLFINTPFFYYNENTNTCEIFSYTGVGGNSNRFKTLAECQRTCVKTPRTYSCTGWSDPGTSYKNIPAYYYNTERQQCEQFTYTGEGGNSNRYDTLYDCQKNCQIAQRRVYSCTGLYDVGTSYKSIPAYYYNTESQTCEEFTYSGEGGNANRYDTLHHCQMNCMPRKNQNNNRLYSCSGLYDVGTSYKSIPAYYYNTQSQTCEEFTYSGEGGNANRYDTLHDCQKNCVTKKRTIYTCTGLADPGIGYDQIVAYYYNEDRGQCEDFIYSGKGGNPNNYESLYECQSKCEKPIRNPCNEPADRGMGFQSITAYYYSQYDSKCKKFTYRGHGGNSNRFSSVFECKKQCAPYKTPHSCSEPKDSGFGNLGDNRDVFYYYNRNSQRCEEFMYLGNGGNTNRYVSLLECQLYCDPGSARRYSCDEPGDSGFGNERIQAYFYNQYTERCEDFMYTNRGGNSNRFDKFIDCQILCES